MPERESFEDQDGSLKEILGFDPESGERLDDLSGLKSIKEPRLAIPQEIQHEFFQVFQREGEYEKIYPEKLLTIGIYQNRVTRSYYSWQPSDEGQTSFPLLVEVSFQQTAKDFEPKEIFFQGEVLPAKLGGFIAGRWIANEFTIISFRDFDQNIISCQFVISKRLFEPNYIQEGQLLSVNFWMQKGSLSSLDENGISIVGRLRELLKNRFLEEKRGINNYQFSAVEEMINLKRLENGELKDELLFPKEINKSLIIEELFHSWTLQDPLNAPPELDDSWHFANLMDVVGVKWERY